MIGLSPSNNGTTLSGLANLGAALGLIAPIATIQPAAIDQTIGSPFNNKLDECPGTTTKYNVCIGDPTVYTVLMVNGDQVVTPYQNAFLKKQPGSTTSVTNTLVNSQCPLELAEHLGMSYSRNVASRALKVLVPSTTATCVLSTPYSGG
jgi:hypothetical protein